MNDLITCSTEDCAQPAYCRGWCRKHYYRQNYLAKRDKALAYRADKYRENADAIKARESAYRYANPHIGWEHTYARRAKRYGHAPHVEAFTRADIVARYGGRCLWCSGPFEELDHVVPVAVGGPHTIDNCVPSCRHCNRTEAAEAREARKAS